MKCLYLLFLIPTFFLASCSSSVKNTDENLNKRPSSFDPEERTTLSRLVVERAVRISTNPNELGNKLSQLIADNPEVSLKRFSRLANTLLNKNGFLMLLQNQDAQIFGSESFTPTRDGTLLNMGLAMEPLCAQSLASQYPIIEFNKDLWTVRGPNKNYIIEAAPLAYGEIRGTSGRTRARIPLPKEASPPDALTKNGRAGLYKIPIAPTLRNWWTARISDELPKNESPFLLIMISENGISISGNTQDYLAALEPQTKEAFLDKDFKVIYANSDYQFYYSLCQESPSN